ncbi:MAG: hypothetical protein JSW00_08790 [Thermoplasmata archaeon]|nr:MAG: hypothetical protein JSW00_08790 [Thermoplasmata archaeon]
MNKGEIIEVDPLDKDDTIVMGFDKVFYSNKSSYIDVYFSKSAIMMVPSMSSGFSAFDSTEGHKTNNEMQYPTVMSEIFDRIQNPTYYQKKEIAKIKLKKSKMMTMVTIELHPGTELYGKQKRRGATLSFLGKDYDIVHFVLNSYFKDKLVLLSKKMR